MVDEKSSRSEAWKDKFKEIFVEACQQTDKLNKKMLLARQAIDDASKNELKGLDPQVLEMENYEMMVRFSLERHKVNDLLFARISSTLDLRRDGKPVMCPDCRGEDKKCKACGGIGRVVDHDLSLNFKILSALGDLSRLLWDLKKSNGGQAQKDDPEEMLKMAFEQLYVAGLRGKEAEAQLKTMAKGLGFSEDDGKQFYDMYEQFCRQKEGGEGASISGQVEDDGKKEKRTG